MLLAVAFTALALFAVCSFRIPRIARRIQAAVETRHIAYGLDDKALEDDVARFKIVAALSVVTLGITTVSFYFGFAR